jgi:ABC-type Zn uptake system ZnuABC Zn-binding protein ZnuA
MLGRPAEVALRALAPSLAPLLAVATAAGAAFGASQEAPLRVVATVEPAAMLVREIGAERVEVTTLVPPGASPHTFEPRPADVARLTDAELFVEVGGPLDAWAGRLRAAATREPARLVLLELPGVRALPADAHGAHPGRLDPHVWLDPIRVRDALAPGIAARLSALDPDGRDLYARRLAEFQDRLAALDAELRALLAGGARRYVAFHAAWRYFGERYDLEEVGVVEEAPGEEPTPRELARLLEAARAAHVRAVLIEPQLPGRVAHSLADELGAELVVVDPNGDPSDPARARYEDLMRWNARAFARALGPPT